MLAPLMVTVSTARRRMGVICAAGILAACALAPSSGIASARETDCGISKRLRLEIRVVHLSCSTGRRIAAALPPHPQGIFHPRGYPSWKCTSGTRLGECALHGRFAEGPEVIYIYR
jgi:hypothetical protein